MADKPDPPSTDENLHALATVVELVTRLSARQAASVAALEDYLREQSWFDEARYETLVRAQQAALTTRLEGLTAGSPAALLAMLRDFEGPPQ